MTKTFFSSSFANLFKHQYGSRVYVQLKVLKGHFVAPTVALGVTICLEYFIRAGVWLLLRLN